MSLTINDALRILTRAKDRLGGNACLILSLTASGLEDVDVTGMTIVSDSEGSRYVQVEARHPALRDP